MEAVFRHDPPYPRPTVAGIAKTGRLGRLCRLLLPYRLTGLHLSLPAPLACAAPNPSYSLNLIWSYLMLLSMVGRVRALFSRKDERAAENGLLPSRPRRALMVSPCLLPDQQLQTPPPNVCPPRTGGTSPRRYWAPARQFVRTQAVRSPVASASPLGTDEEPPGDPPNERPPPPMPPLPPAGM